MKRVFIMLAIVLGSAGLLFAQKSNQKEVKQLQSFLQQNRLREMPIIFVWELPTLRILQCGRG